MPGGKIGGATVHDRSSFRAYVPSRAAASAVPVPRRTTPGARFARPSDDSRGGVVDTTSTAGARREQQPLPDSGAAGEPVEPRPASDPTAGPRPASDPTALRAR